MSEAFHKKEQARLWKDTIVPVGATGFHCTEPKPHIERMYEGRRKLDGQPCRLVPVEGRGNHRSSLVVEQQSSQDFRTFDSKYPAANIDKKGERAVNL